MNKFLSIFFSFIASTFCVTGQTSTVMIGEKAYDATEQITFEYDESGEPLSIQFAKKNENICFLLLTIESPGNSFGNENSVYGTVMIYLTDNTIIKLTDTGKYDCVNDICTTIYNLNLSDINKIKSNNISSIRYIIADRSSKDYYEKPFNQFKKLKKNTKGFTYRTIDGVEIEASHDFTAIIKKLY